MLFVLLQKFVDFGFDAFKNFLNGAGRIDYGNVVAAFKHFECDSVTAAGFGDHCGVFFVNFKMGPARSDMFVAFFRIHIKENADIRFCDERAVKVHGSYPFNGAVNTLVSKGRIIIAVADNVRSLVKMFYNSVFRAYVVGSFRLFCK